MCEFCEMIVVIRLFAWLKGAKWVVECGVLWLETGVFVVGFTDLYVGFWGLEFGLRVSELVSEGLNWGFGGFVFVFGFCVLECGGCRGRNGIRRRGMGGTFLFFGCWKGRESVGLGLGGWKSDVIGRFFRGFFWHIGWNVVPLRLFLNDYNML